MPLQMHTARCLEEGQRQNGFWYKILIHYPELGYVVYVTGNCVDHEHELQEDTRRN